MAWHAPPQAWRPILLLLVILPFWTSFLIRVYAWIGILRTEGLLNQFLLGIGLIDEPLIILNTDTAVYIGIVYTYLPFMVLPLYANLEKMDHALIEAALDLRLHPPECVLACYMALVAVGDHCRLFSCVHPGCGVSLSSRIFWAGQAHS